MKNNIITGIIIFMLVFQFTACKKEEVKKEISNKTVVKPAVEDTIFDRKNIFYPFIKKNHPKVLNEDVMFLQAEDLDSDGREETILGFGRDSDAGPYFENLFILRNEDGNISEIPYNFVDNCPTFTGVRFKSLKGQKEKYIYLEHQYGPLDDSFSLFKLVDNKIKPIFIFESKDDEGFSDGLLDTDEDGVYDGMVKQQQMESGEFIRHFFTFENDVFKPTENPFITKQYPLTVTSVVNQYLNLKSLGFSNNLIEQRLSLLTGNNDPDRSQISDELWNDLSQGTLWDFMLINKTLTENKNKASIIVLFWIRYDTAYLKYSLQKNADKWQIVKMEKVEYNE